MANYNPSTVSVIDTTSNTVVATVSVGNAPIGVAITPLGDFAYVANNVSSTVSVIDTATNTVVATVSVGNAPIGVAITPAGDFAYVTNNNSNSVSVLDTGTNTVVATVTGLRSPWGVAITPQSELLATPFYAIFTPVQTEASGQPSLKEGESKSWIPAPNGAGIQ